MNNSIYLENLLEYLRKKTLPEGIGFDEALEAADKGLKESEDEIDKALLIYYYLSAMESGDRESLDAQVREMGDSFRKENNEKLRGRKLWMLTGKLLTDKSYDRIIALGHELKGMNVSVYVWERFFRQINNYSDRSFRLYPDLANLGLSEEEVPSYKAFLEDQEINIDVAGSLLDHYGNVFPGALDAYCRGEGDPAITESFIFRLAAAGLDLFPSENAFMEKFSGYPYRFRLIHSIFLYIVNLPEESTSLIEALARKGVRLLESLDEEERSLYEEFALLLLRSYEAKENTTKLFEQILNLLIEADKSGDLKSSLEQDLADSFGNVLMRGLLTGVLSPSDYQKIGGLLGCTSPYFRKMGATLILQGIREGYDGDPFVSILLRTYQDNPETKNSLTEGSDIKEEEKVFAYTLLSPKAFFPDPEPEEGFFNLDNLTGLLAMCQPPVTAMRLKLALEEMHIDPMTPLDVPEPALQVTNFTGVFGPIDYKGLIEYMTLWFGLNRDDLEEELSKASESLATRYAREIISTRRNLIKSVFEEDLSAEPLALLEDTWKDLGDKAFPGPFCGKIDEPNPDALAYYLPRASLSEKNKCFSGIYFHYYRMREFIESNGLSPTRVIGAVLVHELFHAFTENCLERRMVKKDDRPGSFCRLEEAAANRAALSWAEGIQDKETFERLKDTLFAEKSRSGSIISGYGEYGFIKDPPELWVPFMLSSGRDNIPEPPQYSEARNQLLLEDLKMHQQIDKAVWSGFVNSMGDELVPLWIDFRCK